MSPCCLKVGQVSKFWDVTVLVVLPKDGFVFFPCDLVDVIYQTTNASLNNIDFVFMNQNGKWHNHNDHVMGHNG
jgi:hypothetical protein